jgi:hypothetical protein
MPLYRSNDTKRGDFFIDGARLAYASDASSDQLAVFTSGAVLVLAFRGTDMDPARFVGSSVPDTPMTTFALESRHAEKQRYEVAVARALKERGFASLDAAPFAPTRNVLRVCTSRPKKDVEVDANMTRDAVIEAATKEYANINPLLGISFLETSERPRQASVDALRLQGGMTMHIAKMSDAAADAALAKVYTTSLSSRYDSAHVRDALTLFNDAKHATAARDALAFVERWLQLWDPKAHPQVLLCGHSLGGSLAHFALLHVLRTRPELLDSVCFVGFNAALLCNFEYLARDGVSSARGYTKKLSARCVHHRNHVDFVSGGAFRTAGGTFIPTYEYKQADDTRWERGAGLRALAESSFTHTGTHGLEALLLCGSFVSASNGARSDAPLGLGVDLGAALRAQSFVAAADLAVVPHLGALGADDAADMV